MPSKKPNKAAKKPRKAAPKKPAAKAANAKKAKRPTMKTGLKSTRTTATVKLAKAKPRSATAKTNAGAHLAREKKAFPAVKPKPAKTVAPAVLAPKPLAPKPFAPRMAAVRGTPIKFDVKPLVGLRTVPIDEDADPDSPPASLLAGPRNVKPYIPRRGEQYMNKEQLEHFALILQNWKRDLMVEVDRTVLHMKDEAANFPDPNDRATQEEEFSLELRTRDRERKLIRKIDDALKRIEDGTYGYCMETGEEIGIKRLEARPVATLSVEAQERRERREKQYGDRDDRYR